MIASRLATLLLAGLLSSISLTGFAAQPSTGPTNPVQEPKPPQLPGGINPDNDSVIKNGALPPGTGVDPRTQGNDTGRQGGMNTDGNGPIGEGKAPGSGNKGLEPEGSVKP
ncbi:hypothetical protein NLK61_04925 [Pseudomonas fuscovaginae UPB0736]|uniref:hypothetical protein n=1 Tax=Pseudomonas asplenii TaxID=53407 RepID=UPI0002891D7C|nr:hypothetical protein [Pseudomonas fuscovaginae]UUQ65993.1 hypothetical protein NLK61_04925 [Pseudomonas fuscovaginae UPB0736]